MQTSQTNSTTTGSRLIRTGHGKGPVPILSTELPASLADLVYPPVSSVGIQEESSAIDDWSIVRHERLHALLVGSQAAADAVLSRVFPDVQWSLALWSPGDGPDRRHGHIALVRDAQDLTDAQQQQLLAWMERHPAIQVISVASRPLYPLVVAGSFRSTLYYRLNSFYFVL